MGLIGLVIFLVATIVIAIFASKYWHWAHVLVVVALTFATVGYANLAYRVLSKRSELQRKEANAQEELDRLQVLNRALVVGTRDPQIVNDLRPQIQLADDATRIDGIVDLEHQLRMINHARGRSWANVRAVGAPDGTGRVEVGVSDDADALNINPGAILYAFEQGAVADGAEYIGEFRVAQAEPRRLLLEPVVDMHPEDAQRYVESAAAGRPWVLHENMPADRYDLLAGLSEEELRGLLPESVIEEYLRHDTPFVEGEDDPLNKMGYNADDQLVGPENMDAATREVFFRKLRDYAYLFQYYDDQWKEQRADRATIQSGTQQMNEANEGAEALLASRQEEKRRLEADREGVTADKVAIESYVAALDQQLANARRLLDETLAANARDAQRLEAIHAALLGVDDLTAQPARARAAADSHGL